jgi:hypothetical protein
MPCEEGNEIDTIRADGQLPQGAFAVDRVRTGTDPQGGNVMNVTKVTPVNPHESYNATAIDAAKQWLGLSTSKGAAPLTDALKDVLVAIKIVLADTGRSVSVDSDLPRNPGLPDTLELPPHILRRYGWDIGSWAKLGRTDVTLRIHTKPGPEVVIECQATRPVGVMILGFIGLRM